MDYIQRFKELLNAYETEFKKWFRDGGKRNKSAGVRLRKIINEMQKIGPALKKQIIEEER